MNIFLSRCTSHLDVFSVFLLDISPSLITGFWLGFAVVKNWQDPKDWVAETELVLFCFCFELLLWWKLCLSIALARSGQPLCLWFWVPSCTFHIQSAIPFQSGNPGFGTEVPSHPSSPAITWYWLLGVANP